MEIGSGPPLLLIHGLFDSLETWEKVVPLLSDRFRIFAIDLPAFGGSPLPEEWTGSVSGMIDAVVAFLNERKLAKVSIVGSSMGGSLALAIAGRHPERVEKLVLLNPYGLPAIPVAVAIAQKMVGKLLPYTLTKEMLRRLAKAIFRRSLHRQELLTEALIERVIRPFSSLPQRKNLFRFLQGISPEETRQVDAMLPNIDRPVLILWGENDRWLPEAHADHLHRCLPQSRVVKLNACGHLPQMEKPKEVAEAIQTFLGAGGR
jgi:pimeloyl-ACP methyl ester carboxylesterase